MEEKHIKKNIREGYAKIARENNSCCAQAASCCTDTRVTTISKGIGYSEGEINSVPEGSNMGLGCGNPTALASLKKGETVLDLGSGGGFDCFLAAEKVGSGGLVIGVDMTPEMIEKARENAEQENFGNVEFRLGEIENLPVADNSIDIIISNCVINLSPDKERVFEEAFRVLKPNGRIMVSDIVLKKELPPSIKKSISAYVACLAGAMLKDEYIEVIKETGFENVRIEWETIMPFKHAENDPTVKAIMGESGISPEEIKSFEKSILSITVYGQKI
ncbi:MAG: arsenite methyltransferase [candidate division WOR-3 bacterium]